MKWLGRLFERKPAEPPPPPPQLRCRPGDVCWFKRDVKTWCSFGWFVSVRAGTVVRVTHHDGTFWQFEQPVLMCHRFDCGGVVESRTTGAVDDLLQPLRDEQGPDETIAWAGLPGQRDLVVSVIPLVPADPVAAPSSLSGRDDLALGLRAGGVFLQA